MLWIEIYKRVTVKSEGEGMRKREEVGRERRRRLRTNEIEREGTERGERGRNKKRTKHWEVGEIYFTRFGNLFFPYRNKYKIIWRRGRDWGGIYCIFRRDIPAHS